MKKADIGTTGTDSKPDEISRACGCSAEGSGPGADYTGISIVISGVLIGSGILSRFAGVESERIQVTIFVGAIAAGGWMLVPSAWKALKLLRPNISLLMVTACIGAAFIGEWAEAATVVFLFGVAEWLEGWADRRAQRAVRSLLDLTPETALVKTNTGLAEMPVGDVAVGAQVFVRNGERIPLDGIVSTGRSAVDQAPITGESIPVEKQPGDLVYAGSINGEGSLEIQVSKEAGDTTLARIIRLVKEAQDQKAPMQRFVDRFAYYYTPAVSLLALLVFLVPPLMLGGDWNTWIYRACVLLVIACPCALVISTPVSVVAGLTALARRGVLVKGGAHLETIGKLRALALDKTGTLTEGKPRVVAVEGVEKSEEETLRLAAAVDEHSSHPLAEAIVAEARDRGIRFARTEHFQTRVGCGAEATLSGRPVFVGNHRLAHALDVCSSGLEQRLLAIEERGHTAIVVGERPHEGEPGRVYGLIAIGDSARRNANAAIAALHGSGVRQIVVLSGDNQRTVDAVAHEVGIDVARGDLLPEDKVATIQSLRSQHTFVGMVGDGVNDAPAMATASVGIAMGTAGTDATIETADITLMRDDLGMIAEAVHLGRRTLAIIRFNITFALATKALFLGLALFGYTSLWLAILADTGATLLVIANALRLLRSRTVSPA